MLNTLCSCIYPIKIPLKYNRKLSNKLLKISYLLFSWFFPRNKTAHMYRPAERASNDALCSGCCLRYARLLPLSFWTYSVFLVKCQIVPCKHTFINIKNAISGYSGALTETDLTWLAVISFPTSNQKSQIENLSNNFYGHIYNNSWEICYNAGYKQVY